MQERAIRRERVEVLLAYARGERICSCSICFNHVNVIGSLLGTWLLIVKWAEPHSLLCIDDFKSIASDTIRYAICTIRLCERGLQIVNRQQ